MVNSNFEENRRRKVLFVLANPSQAEMLASIARELHDWDVMAININTSDQRFEIERGMQELNLPYQTVPIISTSRLKKLLLKEQPDIVVMGNDSNTDELLFIECANSMNIPTLLVQHGIFGQTKNMQANSARIALENLTTYPPRLLRFITNRNFSLHSKIRTILFELRYGVTRKPVIPGHGGCSKIAVFGDATREMLVSEGIDPQTIMVTGNPKFDSVLRYKKKNCKQKVCEKWHIPLHREIVLLLTQNFVEFKMWTPRQRKTFVLVVAKAVAALPNTQLIIKIHSTYENKSDYMEILKDIDEPHIICQYEPLCELINICDLAVTVSSTAGLEALAVGKPLLIVNLFNDDTKIYEGSSILFVDREDDLLSAMQKALCDFKAREEITKRFIYQQAYLQDGQASKRIAELIMNMTVERKINDNN